MNKKHWISVYFNQDITDQQIKALVKKSYELVVKTLTRNEQQML